MSEPHSGHSGERLRQPETDRCRFDAEASVCIRVHPCASVCIRVHPCASVCIRGFETARVWQEHSSVALQPGAFEKPTRRTVLPCRELRPGCSLTRAATGGCSRGRIVGASVSENFAGPARAARSRSLLREGAGGFRRREARPLTESGSRGAVRRAIRAGSPDRLRRHRVREGARTGLRDRG